MRVLVIPLWMCDLGGGIQVWSGGIGVDVLSGCIGVDVLSGCIGVDVLEWMYWSG
jgi:hypothetical protein